MSAGSGSPVSRKLDLLQEETRRGDERPLLAAERGELEAVAERAPIAHRRRNAHRTQQRLAADLHDDVFSHRQIADDGATHAAFAHVVHVTYESALRARAKGLELHVRAKAGELALFLRIAREDGLDLRGRVGV